MATIDQQTQMTPGGNAKFNTLDVSKKAIEATMKDLAGTSTLPESTINQPMDTTPVDPTVVDPTVVDPTTQEEQIS